ncbi:MAG: histidinol-phosphate transaminase [Candidatus Methylomirabilota bacterium]|nr:histidinol-phosphate transaminase [Candidatus Methylomirabilis sp.]NJD68535.1 histidinol-phosphate transaminase [candidate division NC10 bacterium]PWB47927.1 MAG: histidinol-phosphate transaminase [candidate division NC10 bacterium]
MAKSLEELASPYLHGLMPYVPGKPIPEVERELGIAGAIKLASNENPLGPSPLALRALREALSECHRYPDGGGYYLKRALAKRLTLSPDHVILGNGCNELLDLTARCFLLPGDEVVIADPAFVIYGMLSHLHGCRTVRIPLKAWTHDLEAMARAVTSRTKMVFIGNPNNPTGTAVRPTELTAFMDAIPEEVVVVIDEAYIEYISPEMVPDSLSFVRQGRSVVVLRTFSKIYGLAGLRVGYGMAPPPMIELLERIRAPFNVNALAQCAALAALDDKAHLSSSRALNEQGKAYISNELQRLGLGCPPSAANFLLIDLRQDGQAVADALLRMGVIVRPLGGAILKTHIRVTIGTPPENERFVEALRTVLGKEQQSA